MTADELGFASVTPNSLDAVSDRDFLLDLSYAASVSCVHLSRLAEEIVLWSTSEFGFITLSDSFSTGSSIMPQKKNPDFAELIRGKTGRVVGDLVALLVTMKALPLAYNKDLQEDKEGAIDAARTLEDCYTCMAGMISTMAVNEQAMEHQVGKGYLAATDLADYLVKKGLPFRRAMKSSAILCCCASSEAVASSKTCLSTISRTRAICSSPMLSSCLTHGLLLTRARPKVAQVASPFASKWRLSSRQWRLTSSFSIKSISY